MSQQNTSSIFFIPQTNNHQELVFNYLKNQKLLTNTQKNQPNLHWFNLEKENFSIEMVREIISLSSYASYNNESQFYILLHFDLANISAQNALLKTLEEPPEKTTIILTVENQEKLLPTIISRCNLIRINNTNELEILIDRKFLDLLASQKAFSYGEVVGLTENIKTKDEALQLVSNLLKHVNSTSNLKKKHLLLQILLDTHRMIEQNVNIKLALENCFFDILKNRNTK